MIMPGLFLEDSLIRAERVRSYIEKNLRVHDHNTLLNFTVSIGVSLYPTHGIRSDLLVTKADAALYQAKNEGRNRIALAECDEPGNKQSEEPVA
jgi:diguanylate cyclase (GGDEF)-like protein